MLAASVCFHAALPALGGALLARGQLQRAGLPVLGDAGALPDGARFVTGLNLLDPKAVGSEYLVATHAPDEGAERGRVAFACARLLGTGRWWHRVYVGRFVK